MGNKIIKSAAVTLAASLLVLSLSACSSQEQILTGESGAPNSTETSGPSQSSATGTTESSEPNNSQVEITTPTAAPKVEAKIASPDETAELLSYLIEEEKLAHDIYTVMLETWGSKVFGNILQSELSHQSQVLTVMQARDIDDPRAGELGVFENAELQKLYDQLVAKGKKSSVDAIEVGIAIEELDIADITDMLAVAKDADVISALENLRRGSENHLRAFNRQL